MRTDRPAPSDSLLRLGVGRNDATRHRVSLGGSDVKEDADVLLVEPPQFNVLFALYSLIRWPSPQKVSLTQTAHFSRTIQVLDMVAAKKKIKNLSFAFSKVEINNRNITEE